MIFFSLASSPFLCKPVAKCQLASRWPRYHGLDASNNLVDATSAPVNVAISSARYSVIILLPTHSVAQTQLNPQAIYNSIRPCRPSSALSRGDALNAIDAGGIFTSAPRSSSSIVRICTRG